MKARAMVLCAGLGTRLRPLTDELPKPLVPVGDRPLLIHIVEALQARGVGSVVVNTHHLNRYFSSVLDELQVEIQVVHEPEIRGTAGGVAGARMLFGDAPIMVHNGDILTDPPVTALFDAAEEGGLALAVARRPAGTGTVGLDGEGNVVRLRGERFGQEQAGGDYIGVLAVGMRCLEALPERGCLIGDVALPELRQGGSIRTVAAPGAFRDTGDLAGYLDANVDWLRRQGVQFWVGEGARIGSGVELVDSVVGSRAEIVGCGRFERVVVWPGAVAKAPLSDAVVMTSGRVVPKR